MRFGSRSRSEPNISWEYLLDCGFPQINKKGIEYLDWGIYCSQQNKLLLVGFKRAVQCIQRVIFWVWANHQHDGIFNWFGGAFGI